MNDEKEFTDEDRSKAYSIFAFAGVFVLILFLIYEIQNYSISTSTLKTYSSVVLPELNSTIYGRKFFNYGDYFLNIPYVTPTPRFQLSEIKAIDSNNSMYVINYGLGCANGFPRVDSFLNRIYAPEICQNLNIYRCNNTEFVRNENFTSDKLVPVLVYVNDGSWLNRFDSYNLHPQTVVKEFACNINAIVVSFQYRMGFYGYYNIESSSDSPRRNFALSDVRNAIIWVKKYIKNFGGDDTSITVMGRNIGAQLSSILSAEKNVLFNKLILLSGSSYVPTLYEKYYESMFDAPSRKYDVSIRSAIIANCTNENEWRKILLNKKHNINTEATFEFYKQIENCMLSKSREQIEETVKKLPDTFIRWPLTGTAQIPTTPSSMPVIMGVCRRKQKSNNNITNDIKSILKEKLNEIADLRQLEYSPSIIEHYIKEFSNYNNVEESMEKIKRDFTIEGPSLIEAHQRAIDASAPVYYFDYETDLKRTMIDVGILKDEYAEIQESIQNQVCIDDLLFNPINRIEYLGERKIRDQFTKLLRSFIHSGKPIIQESKNKITINTLEWPEFISKDKLTKQNQDKEVNVTLSYDKNLNKIIKFDSIYGAYVSNLNFATKETRRFWLCEMTKNLELKKIFCGSQEN